MRTNECPARAFGVMLESPRAVIPEAGLSKAKGGCPGPIPAHGRVTEWIPDSLRLPG